MFFFQTTISPIHHSLVQIVLHNTDKQNKFWNQKPTNIVWQTVNWIINAKSKTELVIKSIKEWCIGEIAVWKKQIYNLYQGMVYWWNSCLEEKHFTICTKEWCIGEITVWRNTFCNLYQGMCICTWYIGENLLNIPWYRW
jgi:hypothetical protein